MSHKLVSLTLSTLEQFETAFHQIGKGMLFIPMSSPPPARTLLYVRIAAPEIGETFITHGTIVAHRDREQQGRAPGVMLALDGEGRSLKAEMEMAVHAREDYRKLMGVVPSENEATDKVRQAAVSVDAPETLKGGCDGEVANPAFRGETVSNNSPINAAEAAAGKEGDSPEEIEGIMLPPEFVDHLDGTTPIDFSRRFSRPKNEAPQGNSGIEKSIITETPEDGPVDDDALMIAWIRGAGGLDASVSDDAGLLEPERMVNDIQVRVADYIRRIRQIRSKQDALVFSRWFQRAVPLLIDAGAWPVLRDITRIANRIAANKVCFPDLSNPTINPFVIVFYDYTDALASAYDHADDEQRTFIDGLVDQLGYVGVKILGDILHESESRKSRTAAVEAFGRKGAMAMYWVRMLLDDPGKKWYLYRNGLLILSLVGNPEEDMDRVRSFLRHPHERVREEALKASLAYKPADIDHIVIRFLKDTDRRNRLLASDALAQVEGISDDMFDDVVDFLLADPPKNLAEASGYYRSCSRLVRFVGDRDPIPRAAQFESVLMKLVVKFIKMRKWFAILVNSDEYNEINRVLVASVDVLKKIGSPRARTFLGELGAHKKK